MFFKVFAPLVALGMSGVLATPVNTTDPDIGFCGPFMKVSEDKRIAINEEMRMQRTSANASYSREIPVAWNVIRANNGEGNIPDNMISQQMQVLNNFFGPTGLTFKLVSLRRIQQDNWFNYASPYPDGQQLYYQMKDQLYQGNAPNVLNLYTVGYNHGQANGLRGYATFPWDYNNSPRQDGVVFQYGTVPGGNSPTTNLGRILVHEVGHWVGLYHTFWEKSNSPQCTDNDEVADTPIEASPARGCPEGRDTCPAPGQDPIHNHMDYTDDSCRTQFTPGQIQRLKNVIAYYRGIQ